MKCYPMVMTNIAMENDPVEIVDIPIRHGDVFYTYISHYQRVPMGTLQRDQPSMHHGPKLEMSKDHRLGSLGS